MSGFLGLFGWLPSRRAATHRRAQAHRSALAGLGFELAELSVDLRRLAELSQTAEQDDVTAIARETSVTTRILHGFARGDRLASGLSHEELETAWRRLEGNVARARVLGQGPHRVARLKLAAAECERLQELVDRELARL